MHRNNDICYRRRVLIGLLLVLSDSLLLFSQSHDPVNERGIFFTRYYSPREYQNFPQNWAGIQDSRGVMVFANGDGVLKFDGTTWEFHSLPNRGVVRSVTMDANGRVYVGAYDEVGYLDADTLGNYVYVSLLGYLKDDVKEFGDVPNSYAKNDSVVFQTDNGLLIWHDDKFTSLSWPDANSFRRLLLADDIFYVHLENVGLCYLRRGRFEKVNGGEALKGTRVRALLHYDDTTRLVLTHQHGLFLVRKSGVVPLKTPIDDFLARSQVYCGISLPDGTFAIGTLSGGAFIIDRQGRVRSMLNKSSGLGDNTVFAFCTDHQGALWAMLSNGIARIERQIPFTHFLESHSPEGAVNTIGRFNGRLYAGTSVGLFRLERARPPDVLAHFEKVDGINSGVWGMADVGDAMLINTEDGAYALEQNTLRKVNGYPGYSMFPSRSNRDIVFSGLADGLSILKRENGRWVDAGKVNGISAETGEMEETLRGQLWVCTYSEGIFLLTFKQENERTDYLNPQIKQFGTSQGLANGYTRVFHIGDKELFFVKGNENSDRSYFYDENSGKFVQYSDLKHLGLDSVNGFPVTSETNGRFWIRLTSPDANERIIGTRTRDSAFNYQRISFARVARYPLRVVFEEDSIAWWGGSEGIVRVNISWAVNKTAGSHLVHINKILLSDDSVLFSGSNAPLQSLTFPYNLSSFRFEFATSSYDAAEENLYQYYLEGFDEEWSPWTEETMRNYTQIAEGSYVFKVRSKNIYGEISNEASYSFRVAPPWYRTWWMYTFYAVGVSLVLAGLHKWRTYHIRKEKEELEAIVSDRTQEVKTQANQLSKQAAKLRELDEAKSHFFANISHEFRTPLTIILGLLEDLKSKTKRTDEEHNYAIMHRSAKRLQTLIEQLLDLTKLEAKKLKLSIQQGDFFRFLRALAASFESYSIQRRTQYRIFIPEGESDGYFDPDKLEKMVSNLLSNAFKFTPSGGTVTVRAVSEHGYLSVFVEDTGPGIPNDQIQAIFERFYQIDTGHTRRQEGAGIGLALTKELAELHHGRISVESKLGHGTKFSIRLPITRDAYAPDELMYGESIRSDGMSVLTEEILDNYDQSDHVDKGITIAGENVEEEDQPIILLVEDNPDVRQFMANHLQGRVLQAVDGLDGLRQARAELPDLIISDIMMPEMDGVELCRTIKDEENTSHIPVILLTAKADISSRLDGLRTGADDYMTKPFLAEELQTRVKNLIEQRNKLRARFSRTVILKPKDIAITSLDELFLEKVMAVIDKQLDNPEFRVDDFQSDVGMSRMQLHRKLKALTGHSAGDFVRIQRLIRASEMLVKLDSTVSDTCYSTGFTSVSYFAKCFRKQFGVSPKEYIRNHRNPS